MEEFNKLMRMLDWNNPIEIQKQGIKLAKDIECINVFMQPMDKKFHKNVWRNCAVIIYNRTDEELSSYLCDLFEWLQDMNWPGAITIAKRLAKYRNKYDLNLWKEYCLKKAIKLEDESWVYNLNNYDKFI